MIYEVLEACCRLVVVAMIFATIKSNRSRRGLQGLFCSQDGLVAQVTRDDQMVPGITYFLGVFNLKCSRFLEVFVFVLS